MSRAVKGALKLAENRLQLFAAVQKELEPERIVTTANLLKELGVADSNGVNPEKFFQYMRKQSKAQRGVRGETYY